MMNVQLLLLLALVGPFCAFTYASPTSLPEELTSPTLYGTHVFTEERHIPRATDFSQTVPLLDTTEATAGDLAPYHTTEPYHSIEIQTVEPVFHTSAAPKIATTDHQIVVHTTEASEPATTGKEISEGDDEHQHEGLTSGQVVGIVIGTLIALAIVIAVVTAVIRRMGKYTP